MNMLSALLAYQPPHRFLVRAGMVAIVYAAVIFWPGASELIAALGRTVHRARAYCCVAGGRLTG
ncbi:MAG: hypothetical protein WBE86_04060 [Candidatus Acidiferrales bacterium]